jgi:sugar phosphate isomerase/epimerase
MEMAQALFNGAAFTPYAANDTFRVAGIGIFVVLVASAWTSSRAGYWVALVCGAVPGMPLAEARTQIQDGIAAIEPHARANRVKLAIEPLHPMYAADRACVNTLAHANDLCDQLGNGLGLAVDAYHVWWDPDLPRQIARAAKRILTYHVCDWLVPTKDLLLDRGMPGDGVIDLRSIRAMVEAAGYDGHIDIEIFSAQNWWKREPSEVLRICLERHQTVV